MVSGFIFYWVLLQSSDQGINAVECQSASRSYLLICLTIAALCAFVGVAFKLYLDRGHRLSSPLIRLCLTLVLAFVVSSLIIAWEPGIITNEFLKNCQENPEFASRVVMANASGLSKGLVLGGAPSILVYILTLIVVTVVTKSKKR